MHDNSILENKISHDVGSLFKYVYQFTCCGYLFNFSIDVSFMLKWCQHIQLEFGSTTWKWGHWYKCCVHCRWCSKFQTHYLCDDYKYYVATLTLGSWLNVKCKGHVAKSVCLSARLKMNALLFLLFWLYLTTN